MTVAGPPAPLSRRSILIDDVIRFRRTSLHEREKTGMFVVNENDLEYRFGDSGPKYLMKGPRMNFAVVAFQPGQDFQAHYHNVMEENFYVLEGKIDIIVDGKVSTLEKGEFIHIEPGEIHYLKNAYDAPVKMVSGLAPFQEVDKVNVDNPAY